jgi:hypothetical protein
MRGRTLTLYRDDSTVQVVYERVKAVFWTAGNTASSSAATMPRRGTPTTASIGRASASAGSKINRGRAPR